jgi:dihydrolipoamide dehydrogenase
MARVVARSFKKRGIDVVTGRAGRGTHALHRRQRDHGRAGEQTFEVELIVVSVGRRPRTEGLVADGVAVEMNDRGFVVADEYQRTGENGVWAVGDVVAGTPQLAHVGFAEAIVAVKTMLGETVVPVDYGRVPWAIYCHPEVAFAE